MKNKSLLMKSYYNAISAKFDGKILFIGLLNSEFSHFTCFQKIREFLLFLAAVPGPSHILEKTNLLVFSKETREEDTKRKIKRF